MIHPVYGGNKLLKLWPLISEDPDEVKSLGVISMGGPHSNHLFSLAGLCFEKGIPLKVIMRGERPGEPSYVVSQIEEWGGELHYVSRDEFRSWREKGDILAGRMTNALWVPEGGSDGSTNDAFRYLINEWYEQGLETDHYLVLASGTGGTISGMIPHFQEGQKLMVINAVPGFPIMEQIRKNCGKEVSNIQIDVVETNDLGRFGKVSGDISEFAWNWQKDYGVPLDPIYTSRIFYMLWQSLLNNPDKYNGTSFQVLHTGGMAGALSWEHKNERMFIPPEIRQGI